MWTSPLWRPPAVVALGLGLGLVLGACGEDATNPADAGSSGGVASGASETLGTGDGSTAGPPTSPTTSTSAETESAETASTEETGEPPPIVPGLRAEYFAEYHDQVRVQVEPQIDVDWGAGAPDPDVGEDRFSVRWTGWITAPRSETYTLISETDDGVRVWVDGVAVIDDWTPHFVTRNEGSVDLVENVPVALVVEVFEIDLEASAKLSWSSETMAEAVIPQSALSTIEPASDEAGPKPPYRNPVVAFDCPDPGVFRSQPDAESPGYYMVCTGGTFPIRYSRDLVHWSDTSSRVLPDGKPSWALNGNRNWAPELHQIDDRVVAYFTTTDAANRLCIGAAWADDPLGPYQETDGPMVQHPQGVIDATYFEEDDGTRWLLYKIDGNSVGQPTPILARELASDGLSFAPGSAEVQLLVNDPGSWEGGVIEAMWITPHEDMLYMFYSGNVYDNRYRTGVARAATMAGPWEKLGPPILGINERWVGPGHGTVLQVEGADYFFYHAWTNAGNGTHLQSEGRHGLLDRIQWEDGWPRISDGSPSSTWLPWPGT